MEAPKRDENGFIRGLWITDVPVTEEAYRNVMRIVGEAENEYENNTIKAFLDTKEETTYLCDDGVVGEPSYFTWERDKDDYFVISYEYFLKTYDGTPVNALKEEPTCDSETCECQREEFPSFEALAKDVDGFPELENDWLGDFIFDYVENIEPSEIYDIFKKAYENGVDVKWKLETYGIDRRLHVNRPLAIAVGKWLVENGSVQLVSEDDLFAVNAVGRGNPFYINGFDGFDRWISEATIAPDFKFPEELLELYKIEKQKEHHECKNS